MRGDLMKNKKKLLTLLGLVFAISLPQGCASLKSVSSTRVPKNRTLPIKAEGFTWAIFGFHFSNSFVDEAITDLQSKCTKGKISGVYTKYSTRSYLFWTTRTINVEAYCLKANTRRA
jgi:hypothetical protein